MKQVISVRDLEEMQRNGKDVRVLPDDAILTPSARDFLRDFEDGAKPHVNGARAVAVTDGKSAAPSRPLSSKSSKAELGSIFQFTVLP